MRLLRFPVLLLAVSLLVVASVGCDSGDSDQDSTIEGQFEAATFSGPDTTGATIDILAEGGSFTLNFDADGTVSGESTLPASVTEPDEGESNVQADGTYTRNGSDLSFDFDNAGDNFLGEFVTDNSDWTYDEGAGEIHSENDEGATVVLERQ